MAKQYFVKFPQIGYDIDGSGEKTLVIDIMQRAAIRNVLQNQSLIFYTYTVKDGETPEIIASKLYGASWYHWIVMLANNIFDVNYDWPMSQDNLQLTIQKRYSSPSQDGLNYSYTAVHHYEDSLGNEIDEFTYRTLPVVERKAVTLYDWEVAQNDAKRTVTLLDAKYKDAIDAELDALMKQATV